MLCVNNYTQKYIDECRTRVVNNSPLTKPWLQQREIILRLMNRCLTLRSRPLNLISLTTWYWLWH